MLSAERKGAMRFNAINAHIATSSFSSENGRRETYVSVTGTKGHARTADALVEMGASVEEALGRCELSIDNLVFSRLYLSDIENQKNEVRGSVLFRLLSRGVLSIIEQPPLSGASLSLLLYFVDGISAGPPDRRTSIGNGAGWRNHRLFAGQHYSMLWAGNFTGPGGPDSAEQTECLFNELNEALATHALSIATDLLRTWVYVRDVDNRYQGMVDARRELFERLGIDKNARYPASTGIEGRAHATDCLVDMDALAFGGLKAEQVIKMEALDHLSPTIRYGVTFERGIRIRFGDRSHLHLSGTASIDKRGDIVHPGDVLKQTERTIANMSALLEGQGGSMRDMAYIILYLRDSSVFEVVKQHLHTLISSDIPLVPVSAAVCRPGWLIEMEGVAIVDDDTPFPAFF